MLITPTQKNPDPNRSTRGSFVEPCRRASPLPVWSGCPKPHEGVHPEANRAVLLFHAPRCFHHPLLPQQNPRGRSPLSSLGVDKP